MENNTKLDPNSNEDQFKLANFWALKGNNQRAIAGYEQIIEIQPNYLPAYLELARLMIKLGKNNEAIAVYRKAIKFNPNEVCLKQYLGQVINSYQLVVPESDNKDFQPIANTENRAGTILLYTDCYSVYGVGQFNHSLMVNFVKYNYHVTCAQHYNSNHLINLRTQLGIQHLWLKHEQHKQAKSFSRFEEAKNIFQLTQPDLIIFSDSQPLSNIPAKETAIELGIPYIVVVNAANSGWAEKYADYLERLPAIYQQAREIIAVSQANLQLLHQKYKLPQKQGKVIYYGRPQKYFTSSNGIPKNRLRQELNIPEDAIILFTSARLDFVKGYQYQLEAIKQLQQNPICSKLYFIWAGIGTFEAQLRFTAASLNNPKQIKFLGERDDIPDLLDAADIFILPSHFEGMPLAIMEAMAKGLPVIASSVSGIPEQLGDTGKLLPDPNVDPKATTAELVSTITAWSTNTKLRQTIGCACKKRADLMFQEQRMFDEYLTIVQQVK